MKYMEASTVETSTKTFVKPSTEIPKETSLEGFMKVVESSIRVAEAFI